MNSVLFRNPLVSMKSDSLHEIVGRQSANKRRTNNAKEMQLRKIGNNIAGETEILIQFNHTS